MPKNRKKSGGKRTNINWGRKLRTAAQNAPAAKRIALTGIPNGRRENSEDFWSLRCFKCFKEFTERNFAPSAYTEKSDFRQSKFGASDCLSEQGKSLNAILLSVSTPTQSDDSRPSNFAASPHLNQQRVHFYDPHTRKNRATHQVKHGFFATSFQQLSDLILKFAAQ